MFKHSTIKTLTFILVLITTGQASSQKKLEKDIKTQAKTKMTEYQFKRKDYVIALSIPKCGTHLISKCLDLLNIKDIRAQYQHAWEHEKTMPLAIKNNALLAPDYLRGRYHTPSIGKWPIDLMKKIKRSKNSNRLFSDHWPYTEEANELFAQCCSARFFIFRDPRDMLVSMTYFVHKGPDNLCVDVNALILDFIDGRKKSFVPWAVAINELYPLLYDYGVTDFYKLFLPWITNPRFLAVKFEDLVGPHGGGSLETQINTIKQMAHHLGVACSDEQIYHVTQNLFGKSSTFREGKIGSWRKHFTQEMIDAYKKVPGACQLLIDLGYEKDTNW